MAVDAELLRKIDDWITANMDEFLKDILSLIEIRSVGEETGTYNAPYGEGCRKALDTALCICDRMGFETTDHDGYCGTALIKGREEKQIGVFTHLDIVPEGDGWSFAPFRPFVSDGFIFGRGALDNKGAAVATMYTAKCMQDLGIKLKNSLLLFFGCNEESGMEDVAYYFKRHQPPAFSYTADADFSVCNSEYGIMSLEIKLNIGGGALVDFRGGKAPNMVPDSAAAVLQGIDLTSAKSKFDKYDMISVEKAGAGVKLSAVGKSSHVAFPEGSVNAIWVIAQALNEQKLAEGKLSNAMHCLQRVLGDCYGHGLGIDDNGQTGSVTHTGGLISVQGDQLVLNVNIRYASSIAQENMLAGIRSVVESYGGAVNVISNDPPMYISADVPLIRELNEICNEVLGTSYEPHDTRGGTYARKIPNAIGYGPNIGTDTNPFEHGKGSGHQSDEVMRIKNLTNAIKIYVHGLMAIDKYI